MAPKKTSIKKITEDRSDSDFEELDDQTLEEKVEELKKPVEKKRKYEEDDDEEITVTKETQTQYVYETSFDYGKAKQIYPMIAEKNKSVLFYCPICGCKLVVDKNFLTCPEDPIHLPVRIQQAQMIWAIENGYFEKLIRKLPKTANTSKLEEPLKDGEKKFPLFVCTCMTRVNGRSVQCNKGELNIQTSSKYPESYGELTFRCGVPGLAANKCQYGKLLRTIVEEVNKNPSAPLSVKLKPVIDAINMSAYNSVSNSLKTKKQTEVAIATDYSKVLLDDE